MKRLAAKKTCSQPKLAVLDTCILPFLIWSLLSQESMLLERWKATQGTLHNDERLTRCCVYAAALRDPDSTAILAPHNASTHCAMQTYCTYCNLQALLVGIEQGQLQWKALPLILQRAVMVAMKASSQGGLSVAAPPLQAYRSQGDQQRTSHSAAGVMNSSYCYAVDIATASGFPTNFQVC